MPGYSGTPLAKKLGLKEGQRVALVGAPTGFRSSLAPVPPGIRWQTDLDGPIGDRARRDRARPPSAHPSIARSYEGASASGPTLPGPLRTRRT